MAATFCLVIVTVFILLIAAGFVLDFAMKRIFSKDYNPRF